MRFRAVFFALVIVSGANAPFSRAEPLPRALASNRIHAGPAGMLVGPAASLAAERLGTAACRTIFEDLNDFTGRPVARRLEAGDRSPSAHFSRLLFVEASGGMCDHGLVAAWTVPGEARVRICPGTFEAIAERDRREAAAILIHEALHTLGVAEDAAPVPLTDFVRARCGL